MKYYKLIGKDKQDYDLLEYIIYIKLNNNNNNIESIHIYLETDWGIYYDYEWYIKFNHLFIHEEISEYDYNLIKMKLL